MLSRISFHSRCIARKVRARKPITFHIMGIAREIRDAYYLSTPLAIRIAYAVVS